MSNPSASENGKLFDWKKSARYCWKQSFPLAHVDRAERVKGAAAPPSLPAAFELLAKPSAGTPKP